jgi:hypothetical protein
MFPPIRCTCPPSINCAIKLSHTLAIMKISKLKRGKKYRYDLYFTVEIETCKAIKK